MKKLLLAIAFGAVGLLSAKNLESQRITNCVVVETESYYEMKFDDIGYCYTRICKYESVDQGDGTLVEVKVCGPWISVQCPQGGNSGGNYA